MTETTVAESIRIVDEKAAYDAACKRVLAEKIILAWIMKHCLIEFRDCEVSEIAEKFIEGTPQVSEIPVAPDETNQTPRIAQTGVEDKTLTEGTITYDIRFDALAPVSGELIGLIINLEAQNKYDPGYPLTKRGIYYCGRMISAQYGTVFTKAHYEKLKKVYSVWICTHPPRNRENTITRYLFHEENLIGNVKEKEQNYDLMSVIMVCLGSPESENYEGVLKLLGVLLSKDMAYSEKQRILESEFDIPMKEKLESEVSTMCNLSDGVEAIGIEKGIAIGIERGIERGVERGIETNTLQSIQSLMETLHLTAEQAMEALKVPKESREKYIEMLNQ